MTKLLFITLGIASIGATGYFMLRKSSDKLRSDIEALVPGADIPDKLARMTRQELLDTYNYIKQVLVGQKEQVAPLLRQRINVISEKYALFT